MRFLILILVFAFAQASCANADEVGNPELPDSADFSDTLKVLLSVEENQVDLAWSKIVIDSLLSDIDQERTSENIQNLAEEAKAMAGPFASDQAKLAALRKVIYETGPWNQGRPFSYDFENPNGRLARNKTLQEYMHTRKGNCVNMPILFMLVGERMGLEMNITTAPRHVFVQFKDTESGEVIHLEPTSGAYPQRVAWQRKVLPMTDRAIETGMYMKRLSKREQIVVMAETLLQALTEQENHPERIEVSELMLEVMPQFDIALLHRQDAFQIAIETEFQSKYPSPDQIPADIYPVFAQFARARDAALGRLHSLGWQPAQDTDGVFIPD